MSKSQQRRAEVLGRLDAERISRSEAQSLLGLSKRQMNRALSNYRANGLASVVHGNAGRTPANKTANDVKERLLCLMDDGGKYHGFNICHASDLLAENEGIVIGRAGVWSNQVEPWYVQTPATRA